MSTCWKECIFYLNIIEHFQERKREDENQFENIFTAQIDDDDSGRWRMERIKLSIEQLLWLLQGKILTRNNFSQINIKSDLQVITLFVI